MGADCTLPCCVSDKNERDPFGEPLERMKRVQTSHEYDDVTRTIKKGPIPNIGEIPTDKTIPSEFYLNPTNGSNNYRFQNELRITQSSAEGRDTIISHSYRRQIPQNSEIYLQYPEEDESIRVYKPKPFSSSNLPFQSTTQINALEDMKSRNLLSIPSSANKSHYQEQRKEFSEIKEQKEKKHKDGEPHVNCETFDDLLNEKQWIRYSNVNYLQSGAHDHSIQVESSFIEIGQPHIPINTAFKRNKQNLNLPVQSE